MTGASSGTFCSMSRSYSQRVTVLLCKPCCRTEIPSTHVPAGIGLGIAIKCASRPKTAFGPNRRTKQQPALFVAITTDTRKILAALNVAGLARSRENVSLWCRYLEEGDNVVLVGRSLDRLQKALPPDFKPKGKPHFVAKDVSQVRAHAWEVGCMSRWVHLCQA